MWWRPTRGKLFQCRCKTNKKTTDNIVGQLWNCRHNKLEIADAEGELRPKIANKNHDPTNFFMRGRTTNEHHKIWLKHNWEFFGTTIWKLYFTRNYLRVHPRCADAYNCLGPNLGGDETLKRVSAIKYFIPQLCLWVAIWLGLQTTPLQIWIESTINRWYFECTSIWTSIVKRLWKAKKMVNVQFKLQDILWFRYEHPLKCKKS